MIDLARMRSVGRDDQKGGMDVSNVGFYLGTLYHFWFYEVALRHLVRDSAARRNLVGHLER